MYSNNYLYIQDASTKVKLLSENGFWTWEIGGVTIRISAAVEREIAYMLWRHDPQYPTLHFKLLAPIMRQIKGLDVDDLFKDFIKLHYSEKIDDYRIEDIPLYADQNGLELIVSEKHSLFISPKDEIKLLATIINTPHCTKRCAAYMNDICKCQNVDFSRQTNGVEQGLYLFHEFLRQHGIFFDDLTKARHKQLPRNEEIEELIIPNPEEINEEKTSWFGALMVIITALTIIWDGLFYSKWKIPGAALLPQIVVVNIYMMTKKMLTRPALLLSAVYGLLTTAAYSFAMLRDWIEDDLLGIFHLLAVIVSIILTISTFIRFHKKYH